MGHRVYKSPYRESGEYTSPSLILTCAHTHKPLLPKSSPYYKGETHLLYAALYAAQQSSATISSSNIKDCVLHEEQLLQCHKHLGIPLTSGSGESTALTTTTNKPRPVCANCKHNNHHTKFCIAPGGQMAGKSIDKAHNAQRMGRQQSCGTCNTACYVSALSHP